MVLSSDSYRVLDPKNYWAFFDSGFGVSADIRDAVRPLTEAASAAFWHEYVSANPRERHPMLLPNEHWMQPIEHGPNWIPEFNAAPAAVRSDEESVCGFLRRCFDLDESEPVFFVDMREHSYSVSMEWFLRGWPCFLTMNDEGPFLYHLRSGKFAWFGPTGYLSFGQRKEHTPPSLSSPKA